MLPNLSLNPCKVGAGPGTTVSTSTSLRLKVDAAINALKESDGRELLDALTFLPLHRFDATFELWSSIPVRAALLASKLERFVDTAGKPTSLRQFDVITNVRQTLHFLRDWKEWQKETLRTAVRDALTALYFGTEHTLRNLNTALKKLQGLQDHSIVDLWSAISDEEIASLLLQLGEYANDRNAKYLARVKETTGEDYSPVDADNDFLGAALNTLDFLKELQQARNPRVEGGSSSTSTREPSVRRPIAEDAPVHKRRRGPA